MTRLNFTEEGSGSEIQMCVENKGVFYTPELMTSEVCTPCIYFRGSQIFSHDHILYLKRLLKRKALHPHQGAKGWKVTVGPEGHPARRPELVGPEEPGSHSQREPGAPATAAEPLSLRFHTTIGAPASKYENSPSIYLLGASHFPLAYLLAPSKSIR